MKKVKEIIIKIWKDTVGSAVISAGIIFLFATLWAKYSHYTLTDIYNFSIDILSFKIPVFLFLSVIGIILLTIALIKILRNKKDPIWDEQIGNYTFKELYIILQNQNLIMKNELMRYTGREAPTEDLLILFRTYSAFLNKGITLEDNLGDGGYGYSSLAPWLVNYGIVEAIEKKNRQLDEMDIVYKTTVLGHKFFSLIEKVIHSKKIKSKPNFKL